MPLQPGDLLSHYRLIARIGEGGMGIVWEAFDTTLARHVALKVLPDALVQNRERLAMFEREARALAALNHPNIVTIHSVEEAAGHRFLTMELVEGRTLAQLLAGGGLPLPRLLAVAVPLTEALDAAHKRGVTHRDIKPGNIMVSESGRVKVLDFGLAKLSARVPARHPGDLRTWPEAPEGFAGTVFYMAPEQLLGEPMDERSDIFSLGVVLYEMATGRRPFEAPSPPGLIASILRDTPSPPTRLNASLPEQLVRLIGDCLEKDPTHRPQSAEVVWRSLTRLKREVDAGRTPAIRSIAVLPFADMSPTQDQGYFCEGVAEEIMNALGRVQGLRVASRPSAFRYQRTAPDVKRIGHRLQVSTVLGGSVRKAGDRVRIGVELVDASDGFRIWSERYDLPFEDIFAVQDEIARRVVDALELTLSARERAALQRASTPDLGAYDVYLRGRQLYYQYNRRDVIAARDLFTHAAALDPGYARAYAGLADCCVYLFLYAGRDPAYLTQAEAATRRALELDPDLAEAHASLGMCLSSAGRHAEAEAEFRAASELNPDLFEAHYFYARDSFTQGKLDQAVRAYEEASRVRPDDYQAPLLVAQIYDDLGRSAEAQASRRRGVQAAEEHLRSNERDARAWYMGANGLVAMGERDRGLEWARRALEIDPDEPMLLYNIACIYCLAGRKDEALDCLERAAVGGAAQREWLAHDSNLDSIRDEPRFQSLMARLEQPVPPA
jgi:serine/threonine protein kinase/Flp pilus assembly protein TadD